MSPPSPDPECCISQISLTIRRVLAWYLAHSIDAIPSKYTSLARPVTAPPLPPPSLPPPFPLPNPQRFQHGSRIPSTQA